MASSRVRTPLLVSIAAATLLGAAALAPRPGAIADARRGRDEPAPLAVMVRIGDRPAVLLDGATLAGDVLISAVPSARILEASFHLDDPDRSAPPRVERSPPFDFQGEAHGSPVPWDTRTVPDGAHEIVVLLILTDGSRLELRARFTVANHPPVFRFEDEAVHAAFSPAAPAARSREVHLLGDPGVRFTLSGDAPPWLEVAAAGETTPATIILRIDPASLAVGAHEATIVAGAAGRPPVRLLVRATVHGERQALASSVERHGFLWQFDDLYPVGRFATGDPWVIGPVGIISVIPGWTGELDGSMVNPRFGGRQGYDSRFSFDEALRARLPRLALPGESIVSVRSWRRGEADCPSVENTLGIPRPALRSAAVLTVLHAVPPAGSFRPPYAGTEKPLFSIDRLRPELLPALPRVDDAPDLHALELRLERVWLDQVEKWQGAYLHPSENMRDYGRDLAREFNDGSLLLLSDHSAEEKQRLMVRLVQIGIDLNGVLRAGGHWGDTGGGIGSGRKWPILLAGILLDDPAMKGIGREFGPEIFLEDCQTFTLGEAERARYPGSAVGDPVWGERHCTARGETSDPGTIGYRTCCTANAWVGAVLSAHILGARELWNHEPLFDYQDRYMAEQAPGDWQRSLSDFAEAMWDTYRARYGPVWPHD